MIPLLLILVTTALQSPQALHPVRWTTAVGPPSRQALQAKLKRPVKRPRGQEIYEHTESQGEIRTCADYARAKKNGWSDSANTYERSTESFFKDQCDVLLLVLTAKPSRISYVTDFKFDETALDMLPPSLSWILSGDEEAAAGKAERRGLSWRKFKPGVKVLKKDADWISVEEPGSARISLELKAFGDFNGDGIEDVLLFKSTSAINATYRYYEPVILTRTADGRLLKVLKIEEKRH
jgi:hypothetical protein